MEDLSVGRLSVVGGLVEDLSVVGGGPVGGSVVGGLVIRRFGSLLKHIHIL